VPHAPASARALPDTPTADAPVEPHPARVFITTSPEPAAAVVPARPGAAVVVPPSSSGLGAPPRGAPACAVGPVAVPSPAAASSPARQGVATAARRRAPTPASPGPAAIVVPARPGAAVIVASSLTGPPHRLAAGAGPPTAVTFSRALAPSRYRAVLRTCAVPQEEGATESSRSGRQWGHRSLDGMSQWARTRRLFLAMGLDLETCAANDAAACLEALKTSGALDEAAVAARDRAASDPSCAAPSGWLSTATAAYPILDGSCLHAGGISLVPVLRRLRRPGVRWREVAGIACLGADAPVIEAHRPTGSTRNYPTDPDEVDALRTLIDRDVRLRWLAPVPAHLDTASLRRNAPLAVVPKSDGSWRMVVDDTAAKVLAADGLPSGVNRRMDTSVLRFPDAGSAPLAASVVDAFGTSAFVGSADISKAYRRIGNCPAAQGLLVVRGLDGTPFFTQTAGMGTSHSASALSTVTRAVGEALSTSDDACVFYADDAFLASRDSGSSLPRRLADICSDLGIPVNPDKSDAALTDVADWCGLRIHAARPHVPASVAFKPTTLASVAAALASVRPSTPIAREPTGKLLGRLAWFACLAPPLRAWTRRLWSCYAPLASGAIPSARWSAPAAAAALRLSRMLRTHGTVQAHAVAASGAGPDPHPDRVLITDACSSGGGLLDVDLRASSNGRRADGSFGSVHPTAAWYCYWPMAIPQSVSSELAMATVAVERECRLHPGSSVHLLSDSVAAICAATSFKTSASAGYADDLLERLAAALLSSHTRLHASHLPGLRNGAADALSRHGSQALTVPSWPSAICDAGLACSPFLRTREDCCLPLSPPLHQLELVLDAHGRPFAPRWPPCKLAASDGLSLGSSQCTTAGAGCAAPLPSATGRASPPRPRRRFRPKVALLSTPHSH